jgi:threonyl-tRNA synthetase
MKILALHCDYINFKPLKKALKKIAELPENQKKEKQIKDALVILTAVEKTDSDVEKIIEKLNENIIEIAKQVNAKNIVLYPYAHLSKDLSSPEIAIKVLEEAEKKLKKSFNVTRAPFGYYKEFELKVKGHPLSELSREIRLDGKVTEADLTDAERKRLLKEISKTKLDTSKLKENDHRILGQKMNLWSFNEVAPGMVFWHPKGLFIKNKLIEYWREVHEKAGYEEISTPQIMDRKLWEISGHWRLYNENNFKTSYEKRDFLVKPMNCPGGMLVFKNSPKSYKDLPLRVGELGIVHRVELSGVLAGLFRVIQFLQDDAHIFCTEKQLHQEIVKVLNLFLEMLKKFGFKEYKFTISVRSEEKKDKYLGDDKTWEKAEKALAKGLDTLGVKYTRMPGEAKFYGPSLDVLIKDSLDREWQCSTLQLDFALPKRFGIEYTTEDNKKETPIMLHRVVFGSLERFIGILTEHLNGNFPLWLNPNQVKVMTLTDNNKKYAKEIYEKLLEAGIKVEFDDRSESMARKARDAQIQKFNYLVTIGDKEEKENKLAIRNRGSKQIESMDINEFISKIKKEIEERL